MKRKNSPPQAPGVFLGTIAIVGRPNVGKSALFNRIAGRQISIVHDQPGVTRDRVSNRCNHDLGSFDLIDTGGIGSVVDSDFDSAVRMEADIALATADLILFVVSGPDGFTNADQDLAKMLRKTAKPVILVVNKIDTEKHESLVHPFQKTGFDPLVGVTAAHGGGVAALATTALGILKSRRPETEEEVIEGWEYAPRIALVGRPNVGKSSMLNALTRSARSIVSDIAGTTRDTVDMPFTYNGKPYLLVDTAGIRARTKHNTSVEVFSVMRSERAIRRADLCILVVDASAGITSQDKKIAGLIQQSGKPCIIALNKWDMLGEGVEEKEVKHEVRESIWKSLFFLNFAPVVFLSALTGQHLGRVFKAIELVRRESDTRISTGQLNRMLQDVFTTHPPAMKGLRRFKLLYATQIRDTSAIPIPHFVFFVNDPKLLSEDYKRYLDSKIRETVPYTGLPLRINFRGRATDTKTKG